MKQFIPYDGVYVIARQLDGHGVIVLLNGTTKSQTINTLRYSELYKREGKKSDSEILLHEKLRDAAINYEMEMHDISKDGEEIDYIRSVYNPQLLVTKDVITGKEVKFGGVMTLGPRQTLILEY